MQLFLKICSGMANSVDPNQSALEKSDLDLHCRHLSFLSETLVHEVLGHKPYC